MDVCVGGEGRARDGHAGARLEPDRSAQDACVGGAGLGQFLSYQVRTLLETGKLKRVLAGFEPAPLPIHAIYPSARLLSSNVRALVDWTVPRLRARVLA